MADANVVTLQRALNRFAGTVGFKPIATDGVVGSVTLSTAKRVLTYIAVSMTDADEPFALQASTLEAKMCVSTMALAVGAAQLGGFLNQVATAWGYPITEGGGITIPGSGSVPAASGGGLTSSLTTAWMRLAAWQKIGAVLFFIVAAMWGRKQWRARKEAR